MFDSSMSQKVSEQQKARKVIGTKRKQLEELTN